MLTRNSQNLPTKPYNFELQISNIKPQVSNLQAKRQPVNPETYLQSPEQQRPTSRIRGLAAVQEVDGLVWGAYSVRRLPWENLLPDHPSTLPLQGPAYSLDHLRRFHNIGQFQK